MNSKTKTFLVLARRDPLEAMRVAAGLTIFGHEVRLIFAGEPLSQQIMESEPAELLELAEIEPETTLSEMADILSVIDSVALVEAITHSDGVINI